jgi:DNA helicase-2/ATP-dependent DNA helicase PcrA
LESAGAIGSLAAVAVLFRTNWQAEELIVAFRERRLPYWVRGGGDLFTRREVRDAIAYLRLSVNPGDVAALARVVNAPPRALGRLAESLRERPCTTDALPARARLYGAASFESAVKFKDLIGFLHEQAPRLAPARLLDLMLERTGYRAWMASRPDGPSRLKGLTDLRRLAERADGGLADWLVELQLGEEATSPADDTDGVLLTTIHRAKGGEWSVVFVVGVEEGLMPHARATTGSSANEVELIGEAGLDEELRVAYVAITRPRERLYLTCCRHRRRGERIESRAASRFLRGLPAELLARAA